MSRVPLLFHISKNPPRFLKLSVVFGNLWCQHDGQINTSIKHNICPPEASLSDFEGFGGVVYTVLWDSLDIQKHHSSSFHHSKLSSIWRKLKSTRKVSLGKIMKEECVQLEIPAERQKSYFLNPEFILIWVV